MHTDTSGSPEARGRVRRRVVGWLLASLPLTACSPALDWRQTAPPMVGLHSLLPCRPVRAERAVPLAGAPVPLQMASCEAGGAMWAIASADVQDRARVGPALQALNDALLANIGAPAAQARPWTLTGASPSARRLEARGRHPDGHAVQLTLLSFAQGTRIYRASVLRSSSEGVPLSEDALTTFIDGLRLQAP